MTLNDKFLPVLCIHSWDSALQLSSYFLLPYKSYNTHGLKSVVYVDWNKSLHNVILYTQNSDKSEILDASALLQDTFNHSIVIIQG
jgi:hypothetical protein